MWLLCRLISTYDQIPDIFFYIISMKCGRHSYLCNVPQWQWVTRNACFHRLGNWTVKMSLLFYFAFVCYECSQGLIMPLEAGKSWASSPYWHPWCGFFSLKSKLFCRQEDTSPHCCSTTLIQAKSFDIKINVAICFEQGGADLQMHVHEWLQWCRQLCKLKDIIATG